ncbi:MAG: hypothetical protein ABIV47_22390 [Roseiflexaceae bacterium]
MATRAVPELARSAGSAQGWDGVARDCQAEGPRACAVYGLYSSDGQQALTDAERAWQLAEQVATPTFRADSAVILGLVTGATCIRIIGGCGGSEHRLS